MWNVGTFDLSDCDFALFLCTVESNVIGALPVLMDLSSSVWTQQSSTGGGAQISGIDHVSALFYLANPGPAETIAAWTAGILAKNAILLRLANVANIGAASNALINGPAYDPGAVRDHLYLSLFTTRLGITITAPPTGFGSMANDINGGTRPSLAYAYLAASGQAIDPDAWTGGSTGRTNWTIASWG